MHRLWAAVSAGLLLAVGACGGSAADQGTPKPGRQAQAPGPSKVPTSLTTVLGVGGTTTAPDADLDGPVSGRTGRPVMLKAGGSFSPLGLRLSFGWDFDSNGFVDEKTSGSTVSHTWAAEYDGPVTVVVTDSAGAHDSATARVMVTRDGDAVRAGDNCPDAANDDQSDYDHDGVGDACDPTPGYDRTNGVVDG
jgi:hypothetical protein